MHLDRFGSEKSGEDRPRDIPHEYEMPGIVPVTPDIDREPDISPAERQKIIDDITRQEEEEKERIKRIDEGETFPTQDQDETPPTLH